MSITKTLINIIEGLEKREFDKLVLLYLHKEYGYKKIVLTDGKDDSGLDIRVFDFKMRKIQFQLTIQKSKSSSEKSSFRKKVIEDIEKAEINYKSYKYENKLLFFYSHPLTVKEIREFERLADRDHNITLELFDANRLSQEIEEIDEIKTHLLKTIGVEIDSQETGNQLIFDLLSFGKPTEFKTQIIEAFIYQLFLKNDKWNFENIKTEIELSFKLDESNQYYLKIIEKFLTEKIIIKDKIDKTFSVSPLVKNELRKKNTDFQLERGLFKNYVENILKQYNQEEYVQEYIEKLTELYTNNFTKELEEISSSQESYLLSSIYKDFSDFIEKKIKGNFDHKELGLQLLKLCLRNKFIQKISASNVYISKINDKQLQRHLNNRKKIFIDTSVALYALCYFLKPKTKFDNFYFIAAKSLIDYAKSEKCNIYISERYVWEIQNHFREAYKLIPFDQILQNHSLGNSRNVFYNFYLYLKKNENYDFSFSQFMHDTGIIENSSKESFNSHILHHLENINIKEQILEKEYNIDGINDLFYSHLRRTYKTKTTFALNCDSILFAYLADPDIEVHQINPIFLTWDKSFQNVQKEYYKLYPNGQRWLNLSPNKFIDSNALLKFSIDNEILTENLLAFISDDIISNTHSLIDTLSLILNPNDEIGLEYTKQLERLREEEISMVATSEVAPPENFDGVAVIDDIIFYITDYYKQRDQITNFRKLFTNKSVIAKVLSVLNEGISYFYANGEINSNIYTEFDEIIKTLDE